MRKMIPFLLGIVLFVWLAKAVFAEADWTFYPEELVPATISAPEQVYAGEVFTVTVTVYAADTLHIQAGEEILTARGYNCSISQLFTAVTDCFLAHRKWETHNLVFTVRAPASGFQTLVEVQKGLYRNWTWVYGVDSSKKVNIVPAPTATPTSTMTPTATAVPTLTAVATIVPNCRLGVEFDKQGFENYAFVVFVSNKNVTGLKVVNESGVVIFKTENLYVAGTVGSFVHSIMSGVSYTMWYRPQGDQAFYACSPSYKKDLVPTPTSTVTATTLSTATEETLTPTATATPGLLPWNSPTPAISTATPTSTPTIVVTALATPIATATETTVATAISTETATPTLIATVVATPDDQILILITQIFLPLVAQR